MCALFQILKKKRRLSTCKGQVSIEILTILALILIVVLTTIFFINDVPSYFSSQSIKQNKDFFKHMQIGIDGILVNSTDTKLYLVNNMREYIIINNISFNDINLEISNLSSWQISPGNLGIYSSNIVTLTNIPVKINILINYSLGGTNYYLDYSNITYEGLQKQ
jgi:hypothetical protein